MKTIDKVKTGNNEILAKLLGYWNEYASYYEKSFGKISVFQGFAKKLEEYLLPTPEGIVLDGGCGPGLQFERIIRATKAKSLIGLDYSPEMLRWAEKSIERVNGKYDCEGKISIFIGYKSIKTIYNQYDFVNLYIAHKTN